MFKRALFRNFRMLYRISRALRHRFTPAGSMLAATAVSAGIFGANTHETLSYQVFSLSGAALLLSLAASVPFRPRVRMHRRLPRHCSVGQPAVYECILESTGRKVQGNWLLYDELREDFPGFEDFIAARDPQDRRRNWFDRAVGYPRLMGLIRRRRGATIDPVQIPGLAPGERTRVRVNLTPVRRGYLHFSRLRLARPDPLGLCNALRGYSQPESLLVLPRTYRVPALALGHNRRYQRGGVNQAGTVGDSQEFLSLRDYRPGDPLRSIHWRSFARTGKPVVKEFQEEYFVRQGLVLDTFVDGHAGSAFEEAVSVAASFALSTRSQDALLDLLFVGMNAFRFTSGRGLGPVEGMLEILACVEPCRTRPFADLARLVDQHAGETSGLVCVLLDWDEPRRNLVRNLSARGVPVLALVVGEAAESALDPGPLGDHPERLITIPTGAVQAALDRGLGDAGMTT